MRKTRRLRDEGQTGGVSDLSRAREVLEEMDPVRLIEETFKAELAPYVREQITEKVTQALEAMAEMAPVLVESLAADLVSDDAVARGRAQTLMSKYLFGQVESEKNTPGGLTVVMPTGMPSPADTPAEAPAVAVESDATEQITCGECGEEKTVGVDIEEGAVRCDACQSKLRAEVLGRFDDPVE